MENQESKVLQAHRAHLDDQAKMVLKALLVKRASLEKLAWQVLRGL